ncbi:hypothetical protein [Haloprofundus halobius]|uniref:hypothetical protein n=1 Tax=Haloprofundus halobius TaxID=2876194 RepID=UPI001CCFCABE|nr:hypothetical protein [Haloprofundus halobius]
MLDVVREQTIHTVLIATVASIIAMMGAIYIHQYVATGSPLTAVLEVLTLYVTAYLSLVMPTALLGFSRGHPVGYALGTGNE